MPESKMYFQRLCLICERGRAGGTQPCEHCGYRQPTVEDSEVNGVFEKPWSEATQIYLLRLDMHQIASLLRSGHSDKLEKAIQQLEAPRALKEASNASDL